ncbi:hypothetical protein [Scytonema sp. UIC 10036]|nr:hypothetical protein [Scytonema sp. UIC 10036]
MKNPQNAVALQSTNNKIIKFRKYYPDGTNGTYCAVVRSRQ